MNHPREVSCPCGAPVETDSLPSPARGPVEFECRCGRKLELEASENGWTLKGALVPQGSVPVDGFSRELRRAPDVERYWFEARDDLGRRTPVHVVFSRASRVAEVKHSGAKPLRFEGIEEPTQARRAWIESFERRPMKPRRDREIGPTP